MALPYCRMLAENRDQLETEIFLRLSAAAVLNGHVVPEPVLRGRVRLLVDAFLGALGPVEDGFRNYIEAITAERVHEGMSLHELQLALQVLEERTWQLIVESVPMAQQVSCLARITSVVGEAKDRIAHVFLHEMEAAEAGRDFACRNVVRLSAGTDPGLVSEDDLNWQSGTPHPHATIV